MHTHTPQKFYSEAIERRTQHWQLLQSLQSERFLDGIGQEGRDALNASLWSISPSLSRTGSIDNLALKRKSSPTMRPLRRNPLVRTKSEEQSQIFMARNNSMEHIRINSAACVGDRLRAAGSLDMLLEHPNVPTQLRGSHSQSQLTTSVLFKHDSEEALSTSLQQISSSSPLSQDSGTESGGTISADTLDLSDEEVPNLSSGGNKEAIQQNSLSADCTVTSTLVESEKLKPILRHEPLDTLKSILRREQLGLPCKPLNRVKSDDSGIAIKQGSSYEFQNSNSPSPCGRVSVPGTLHPRPKMKVHFRSQSDTSTINLDILTPTSEETAIIVLTDPTDEATPSTTPPLNKQSIEFDSSTNRVQSPRSPKGHSHSSTGSNTTNIDTKPLQVESHVTIPSPKLSRLPAPPVSKKPLCRSKKIEKTPPQSPAKTSVPVPRRKSVVVGGQPKPLPTNKKPITEVQGASSPPKKKPSQLRRPSVVTKQLCYSNVSVKEVKQKFEPVTSVAKLPTKEERVAKNQSLSASKSAVTVRKTSQQQLSAIATHHRSKSINDISNFKRQGAVRTRPSPPGQRAKKTIAPKQSSLARSSTINPPKSKPPIGKSRKRASLDDPRTEPTIRSPSIDRDVLSELAALSLPRRVSKLPHRVSKVESPDSKGIRIEVDGSERGIDIPLNVNSNNNNKTSTSENNNEPKRKESTYHILNAVTVGWADRKCSALPYRQKRSPMEWNQFGTTWKRPQHSSLYTSEQCPKQLHS